MSRIRFDITGELTTLSPLHVGTGAFTMMDNVSGKAGKNAAPRVARIARDAQGRPLIPSTTVKGILLDLARSLPEGTRPDRDAIEALFGTIKAATTKQQEETDTKGTDGTNKTKDEKPAGRMGALTLFSAVRTGATPDTEAYPHGADGCFVAARTSVDGASGVAADAKLFHQEMVAPGTRFSFRCRLEGRGKAAEDTEARLTALLPVLAALTHKDGVPLGKGQADGFGLVRLDGSSLSVTRRALDDQGNFVAKRQAVTLPKAVRRQVDRRYGLSLVCEGPFAILDGSFQSNKGKRDKTDKEPNARAQSRGKGLPLVLGSSLSGALRSRAVWLENLRRHRAGAPLVDPASEDPNAVNRLFGRTGFRGLLTIEALTVDEAREKPMTSVKIDRFSGAPIDNALVTTQTFIGVKARVTLALEARGKEQATEADRALLDSLLEDLRDNGLMLGHGTNKGFGWFDVTTEEIDG